MPRNVPCFYYNIASHASASCCQVPWLTGVYVALLLPLSPALAAAAVVAAVPVFL
jgi:hypothetical protein